VKKQCRKLLRGRRDDIPNEEIAALLAVFINLAASITPSHAAIGEAMLLLIAK
jgi:hypothetical protein